MSVTPKKASNKLTKKKVSVAELASAKTENEERINGGGKNLDKLNVKTEKNLHKLNENDSDENMDSTSFEKEWDIPLDDSPTTDNIKLDIDNEDDEEKLDIDCVNERRLFYDCTNGDLEKYKFCVGLDSENETASVWIGVTSKTSPFRYYICAKNENGHLSTVFLDQIMFSQLQTAFVSFLQYGNPNHLWTADGITSTHPLEFSTTNNCLQVKHILNPMNPIIFTMQHIHRFHEKKWEIQRFVRFIIKKIQLVSYGESILSHFVEESRNVLKDDFIREFVNPPNTMLTAHHIWEVLKKKYMN